MSDNTHPGIRSARPTIAIAGEDDSVLVEGLQRLEIAESIDGLYRCEATFANWGARNGGVDFLYFDRRKLEFGRSLTVKLARQTLFDGRILGLEASFPEAAPAEITVLAEDRFQDLRMTRRTRTFADVSDAEVFRQVATDHGLSPQVRVDGPSYRVLAQVNQSDLAFLRERARSIDAELWTEGTTLHAESRTNRRQAPLELTFRHQLRSFSALADLATQRSSLTASGWDVAAKSVLTHEASATVIQNELNGDDSGVSILKSTLGDRKEAVAHTVPLNSQEVQSSAESWFKRCARRFVAGRGIAETQAGLKAGAVVNLLKLGPLFSGRYYVVSSRVLFDSQRGLRTEFAVERAGLGQPA